MKISARSFGGELFRPTPEIHIEENSALSIVATAWGPKPSAKKLIQSIIDFFHSASNDTEVTSPFQKLSCLSPRANNLRAAIMLANDVVYREDNKNEYLTGLELFASALRNDEFVWASVGQPSVLLLRENKLFPLTIGIESTLEQSVEWLAPLPQNFLGAHSTSNFEMRSLKLQEQDQIVLISRSFLCQSLFEKHQDKLTLELISLLLAKDNLRMPFWVGILDRAA